MARMRKHLLPAVVLGAVCSLAWTGHSADAENVDDVRISREADHARSLITDRFMELLAVRPGMTVLDIGTGTGHFAYAFAERLKGTGRVFATDIDNACIDFVKREAGRRGLKNLYPVLVTPEGVDAFYGRHEYDLITLINVPIPDKAAYFGKMREYLAKDGRLVFVLYKNTTPFSERDFEGRFPGLIRTLASEPAGSPFLAGLRKSTRRSIAEYSGGEPDEPLRKALIEDFRLMEDDTRFGRDFVDGPVIRDEAAFTPEERDFAEYLFLLLREKGVLNSEQRPKSGKEIRVAQRFNKLLFLRKFREYLHEDRLFAPGMKPETKAEFEEAGLRLEKEHHDVLRFEDVLVFRRRE